MGIESIVKQFLGTASKAAEGFADSSASVLGTVIRHGVGGTLGAVGRSAWGSAPQWGLRAATRTAPLRPTMLSGAIPGIARELFPSFSRGTLGALPKFAGAAFINRYLETPDAQDLSGAQQFGLRAVSFGLKFGAYRSLARGFAGTALSLAGRASGDPGRFYGSYNKAAKALGPFWKSGSLLNKGLRGVGGLAREVGYLPLRMLTGSGTALKTSAGMASLALADQAWIPGAGRPFLKIAEKLGAETYSAALHPKAGPINRAINKVLPGFLGKNLEAPLASGMLFLGGAGGYFAARSEYKNRHKNWLGGPKYNPMNYGGGISVMRRGGAQNFGPSLTLMLHANHRRVMP